MNKLYLFLYFFLLALPIVSAVDVGEKVEVVEVRKFAVNIDKTALDPLNNPYHPERPGSYEETIELEPVLPKIETQIVTTQPMQQKEEDISSNNLFIFIFVFGQLAFIVLLLFLAIIFYINFTKTKKAIKIKIKRK